MRKFWLGGIGGIFLGGLVGYFMISQSEPYRLNYKHIAINILLEHSADLNKVQYTLGEKYLAEDMVKEFKKQNIEARVYTLEETYSNRGFKEGYEIYMRPLPELQFDDYHSVFDKDRVAVLFETFTYKLNEVKKADIVFTGSLKKNREYRELGINSYVLLKLIFLSKFIFFFPISIS